MMNNENRLSSGRAESFSHLFRIRTTLFCWVLAFMLVAACTPKKAPPPPPPNLYPSMVIIQDGIAFMVHRLRLPGTRQEIALRFNGSRQWMDLNLLQSLRFTGPSQGGYRQAEIILISGERMQAKVFVNTIVEGNTDLGYWNMSLSKIERLDLGSD